MSSASLLSNPVDDDPWPTARFYYDNWLRVSNDHYRSCGQNGAAWGPFLDYESSSQVPEPKLMASFIADAMPGQWKCTRDNINLRTLKSSSTTSFRVLVLEVENLDYLDRTILGLVLGYYCVEPTFAERLGEHHHKSPSWFDISGACDGRTDSRYYARSLIGRMRNPCLELPRSGEHGCSFITTIVDDPAHGFPTAIIVSVASMIRSQSWKPPDRFSRASHPYLFAASSSSEPRVEDYENVIGLFANRISVASPDIQRVTSAELVPGSRQRAVAQVVLLFATLMAEDVELRVEGLAWLIACIPRRQRGLRNKLNKDDYRMTAESFADQIATIRLNLHTARTNYTAFIESLGPKSAELAVVGIRYEGILSRVLDRTIALQECLENSLQRHLANMSLQESKKSIALADNVRIVTQLALIFLPLSFSSSTFGMNIKEFDSGVTPIAHFLITAIVIVAVTVIAWYIFASLHILWEMLGRTMSKALHPDSFLVLCIISVWPNVMIFYLRLQDGIKNALRAAKQLFWAQS